MRTKDDILSDSLRDITNDKYKQDAHLWLEVRKIEVLLDIRDILVTDAKDAMNALIEIRKTQ